MSTDQSYDDFVLGIYKALLKDCALQYPGLAVEFDRDYKRLSSSLEHHGLHFFLEIMPAYRKHFDQCLATRRLTLTPLTNFGSWKRKGGMVPRLFRGLFLRVFELYGELRDQPDENAIRLVRQLLGVVRKLRLDSNIRDKCETVDEFYRVDGSVRNGRSEFWQTTSPAEVVYSDSPVAFDDLGEGHTDSHDYHESTPRQGSFDFERSATPVTPVMELLSNVQRCADIVSATLGVFTPMEWRPKHGPGAVSDQQFGSNKYRFECWPDRLETAFPYADFAFANYAQWSDGLKVHDITAEFTHEHPAVLHAVPKTLCKPRLIASEPTYLQWCQQVIRDFMYSRVSETFIGNFIDFRRQNLNGDLALEASHLQSHSTIDLSSASDRVSCYHVERLFRRSPSVLDALRATRSLWIRQDISRTSPQYHLLRKYSTMGNATTFPVQSILFMVMAVACTLYVRRLPVTIENIVALGKKQVRVFGDDIIVPSDATGTLLGLLESFEMKVNIHKTFVNGQFRESCGVDAYDGHDVTCVNILDVPRDAAPGSVVSSVDVHHNLLDAGYYATAAFVRKTVEQHGYSKIRTVEHRSGAFGWSDRCDCGPTVLKSRWNRELSVREVRCLNPTVKIQRATNVEKHGLLQFFTEAAKKVTSASSTLGYLARRPKVKLDLRWVSIA